MAVQCPTCGVRFHNKFQLGPHRRVCSQTKPEWSDSSSSNGGDNSVNVAQLIGNNVVNVAEIAPLFELAQRPATTEGPWARVVPSARPLGTLRRPELARDYRPVCDVVSTFCLPA